MSSYTITRKLSVEEIQAVVSAFKDKEGIEILKAIRDNAVNESDLPDKEKQKGGKKLSEEQQEEEQQTRAFLGQAKEEDVTGGDEAKKGTLERLESLGLVLKGGYIPLNKERINAYKLTEEGYALLNGVEQEEGEENGGGGKRSSAKLSNNAVVPDDSDNYKKQQQVGAFKSEYHKEFKERNNNSSSNK